MHKNKVQHTPFKPARKDLAEFCFLEQWQTLNTEFPDFLRDILGGIRGDVRNARIAASFITWIGSNAGASFIEQAKARIEDFTYPEPAYLATWALINQRVRYVNSNVRAIEVIMSPENMFLPALGDQPFQRASRLCISLSDIDVVEKMVVWLSTAHGNAFVDSCMAQYEAMRCLERSRNNLALI